MVGLIILLVLVTIAVVLFVYSYSKTGKYEYLEEEIFDTEYGVVGMVKERKENFHSTYTKYNIIGICLYVLAMVPFFTGVMIDEKNLLLMVMLLCVALILIGIGVVLFIKVGIPWAAFEKLLQEGDYTKEKKEKSSMTRVVTVVYWLVVTAVYLAVTLLNREWKEGWIIWVIAAVLFPAVIVIIQAFKKK